MLIEHKLKFCDNLSQNRIENKQLTLVVTKLNVI